jgi:hypothetical protein
MSTRSSFVKQFTLGHLKATIFEVSSSGGRQYSVSVVREYCSGFRPRETTTFGHTDLPQARAILALTENWIARQLYDRPSNHLA